MKPGALVHVQRLLDSPGQFMMIVLLKVGFKIDKTIASSPLVALLSFGHVQAACLVFNLGKAIVQHLIEIKKIIVRHCKVKTVVGGSNEAPVNNR